MDNNDSRKWLYESLKGKGYDLGSYDEFDSHADEADTRKWLYETARESGFDMGSYEDFDKGIGYRAPRQEETISVNPQTIADTFSATKSEYPSLKEMATVSRFAPVDFSQKAEVDAMSPYSVESLGSRLQQLKKDGKLDMIIHQKEERELDRIYSPKKVENETDALENYRGRFRLTERGKFLNEELDGIRKEITDRYTNEYLASDRYKQLSSRYSGKQLNEEIDKDFQQQYGDRISKDMAPYMDAYNQQVFNRYDVGIQDDLTTLAKGRTINQVADLRRDIEQELEKTQPEINAPAGSAFIPSSAYGAAQRYGNVQSKEQQDRYTSLVAAKNLLDEADDIVNEASKKGNTTFLGGFSRGVRDKGFDVDTWAMGITDTAYGSLLRKAAQKSDRGEELSSEEKKLLEAAAVNMATQAYFASDLGRGYKAGGTSAQSIPFMLEFALNPVSGSGNAIAKGILKYGAKRFGLKALESSAVKNGLKVGSRLAGDAVAAAGMTATSGLGHVASGAQERMLGDVQFDFNEDGKIRYTGRENQMSDGDAWLRSTLSNTLENQSEMVFNAFKGAGGVVGVPSTGSLFPGIERFSASKAGELYRAIKNNPTYRKLAERTQFHGMPEEYFEEVYNNLVSLPLGEGSWEESTDIDNNIDTFLGVAPTSIVMSMLGLGSVAKESYSTRRNRERFEKTLSQDELSFFKDLKQRIKDGNIEDAREVVKLTLNDKKLTSEQKKEKIRYVYDMLQENTIEAVRNAEAEDAIQKETDDIVNSSNQADGTVTECSRITTNEIGETVLVPGHIVGWMGGTVVENPDGTQSREGGHPIWQPIGSEERITLHEGEFDPESIKSMPTKDMIDATAEMMREEAQKKAEMESRYDLSRIDPPHADMDFIDKDGNKYHIVDKNPNGGWIAEAFSVDEKGNPTSQMVEITDEEYYDTMQAQLNAQEEAVNIQDESSNLSENQVENETLPLVGENIVIPNEVPDTLGEVNPAPEPTQEQKPALPVDEKGNILYHKMPVEDTIADLTDGTLDDNEIDGFIAANKAEAGKLLKKVSESAPKISTNKAKYLTDKKAWQEKVADAQARVDYWNSIGEEIAASRVQPGDKTAEAILSMGEPMNGEELAAMMLGTGRLPILYDSYKKETGGRNAEARGMIGLFATKTKGGLSIEEAGELLMLADQENGTHFFDENDPNAGRNTIIDVLSGARTRGDLFGFIQRNREVLAERERQAELEAYEQTIARLAEASHMTPEEFIAFEENIAQMLEERLKDIPDEELKSIFAELYLDENYGRSRESDEVGTGVPEGEGRAESNEGSPGVLSEERGDNAGASEQSEERPELDDEIGQSGDGILLEADAVDGREEVAPVGVGPFGNIYTQFKGKAKEAIAFLLGKKSGEAIGALHHPDIGEIDLVWGKVGTGKSNGFGLSKLAEYHPEVLDNLQELLNEMKIVKRSENRINLESNTHKAAIRLEWDGVRKNWLLTAFEKETPTPIDKTTDTGENPNDLQSDTALLQDVSASSENKDSNVSENKQENAGFVSPSRMEGEPILDYAARVVESKRVHDAGSEVDTNPTEAQKEAGNYKKGHVKIDGFDITIENPKGSVRSGVDADGKPWSVTMNNTYGYIRGTEGVDGDHIDVFLGDSGNKVYVVDQLNTETGAFDEHKVMYGFNSTEEATEAYLSNYSPGWQGLGAISEVSKETFKKWINSSHRKTKPFVEYKIAKERVLSEPEYIQSQVDLAFNNRNNQAQTKEEWENADDGIKAYNDASGSYSSYIKHLSDSGNLQRIYDFSNIGDKIQIRENIETAGFEVNDLVDTTKEKTEAKKKREEKKAKKSTETMRKLGLLSSDLDAGVRFREVQDSVSSFASKCNLEEADVRKYAQSMQNGNLGGASYAFQNIRRKVRLDNSNDSFMQFSKRFAPIREKLYEEFGNIDELREEAVRAQMEERNVMEVARKRIEEEAAREREHLQEFQDMSDDHLDEEYFKAVEENNELRMRDLVNEAARRKGYEDIDSDYQGVGAWAAPSDPGYESAEARRADVEENSPDVNIEDISKGYSPQPNDYFSNLRAYGTNTPEGRESAQTINRAIDEIQSTGNIPMVKVYRAVPTEIKEGSIRNADWVTPSRKYAEIHGNARLEGKYRLIEQEVPANELWWDGNDINEWGFDDGKDYRYKNAKNNRKLNDLITRDDNGNIIPLSKRFNSRNKDVRFRETASSEEQAIIEEVNERFNEELSRYKDGRMKPNEMFHLGTPQGAMLAFLPDSPIVMRQKTIRKGTEKKHNVDVDMLKDMPAMIASPIFVFQRDAKKMGILTEMIDRDGKNVCVAIEMNKTIQDGTNILEVNDIRSFHGREVENIIKPIRDNGTLKWVDKEKGLDWITSALHNFKQAQSDQNLSIEDFSSASKIVESFENPTIEQGKIVSAVENLADSLHTPVRAVKSVEELPEGDVARKRIENGDGIKGWFDIKSEEMAIYLPNATSVEDARESVFHEVVGHYGLRKLFGEDFNTFLDNVYANVSPEIRKQIVNRAKEQGNILDLREATEEYLAALAERGFDSVEERTLWQKIKDAFIDMLRKAGVHLGFDLTDNELRYVLWRSYQNLESQSIMDRAADIDMQRRLRVGNFREDEAELHYSELKKEADRLKELTGRDVNLGRNEEEIAFMMSSNGADAGTIDHVRDTFARAREEGKKFFGFFDADTGKVYLCADQLRNKQDIVRYWMHENSHLATLQTLSDSELEDLYDNIGEKEIANLLDESYLRNELSKARIADEYISHIIQNIVSDEQSMENIINGDINEALDNWDILENVIPYIKNNLKYIFDGEKEITKNDKRGSRRMDAVSESGIETAAEERIQGETEKRFRTGEPTGEERGASEKVDKSTLSLNDSAFRMSKWEKIREAYQDGMISVKLMQDYLAQKTGKAIPEWMDVYLYENSKSGRSGYRMEQFHKKLYAPLMQEAGRLMQEDRNNGSSVEEAERLLDVYMKAKHGLEERNERMRREAMLKKINSIKDEDAKSVALQEMGESGIQDIAFSDESLEKFRVNLLLKDYSGLIGLAGKDENGNDKSMPEVERYAREAISTYEANHDTKKLWELVKDVSEYALKEEYEGGLIDKETYETIRDMYKYYIPLRGRNEKTAEDFFSYIERGASDTGFENVIKKAYGHTYESGNAFAYLAKMAETAIVQSEKNRVKQRLLWMARNYRDPSIMEIANVWYVKDSEGQWVEKVPELAGTEGEQKQAMIEFNQQMEELQKEGKAKRKLGKVDIGVPISTYQAQEHQVRVKENGREYVININADPRIAHAINGYGGNEGQLKILLDGIDWTVRNLAALNTSWNPEFAVGNIIRDLEYAAGSSFVKEGVRYAAKGAKNTVPAMAAMQRYFRGKQDMSNQMDKYLQEFFENGGETGFTHLSNLNLHEKRAKKMLKRASRGKELRTGENIINQANRFIEMIPRFTTYVASRESGKSIISSVNDAKNITVNFNRRGSGRMADWRTDGVVVSLATFMAPVLSRMQMFANASIQGTANYFGSAKNHPVRWASTTASVAAMGVLSAIISNMLGGDDEPGYEDIPEWVRHSNFTLFNGKNYFSLPLTMEYRPFYTLGESMAMVYLGKSDMKKAAKSVGVSMWDNWNPLSVELFKSGSPTPLLTPFYENLKDEDYKGSKITGRTSWNAYLPEYQRAKKGTGDVFMWVSEGLNDVTGGNKYERGWAQVNPSQLEHLVMGWSGGTGRAVSGLYEVIKSTIAGEKPELERAPIVRRFYGKVTEENRYRRLRKEFKEKVTEADNLMKSLKRMQKDYENPLDYAARINEIYRDGEYEKAYNLIEDNKTLRDYEAYYNGSETQEDADDVMKSMIDILEEALDE